MTPLARGVAAAFDAIVMVAAAFALTGGSFGDPRQDIVLWGSAAAAIAVALIVLTSGPAVVAWVGIGYVLFAGALAPGGPAPLVLLLAVALMPLVPRPRGSLPLGLSVALLTAVLTGAAISVA